MLDLVARDLSRRILDSSAGSASFDAEVTAEGRSVVSCDPLYRFTAREIRDRIEEPYEVVLASAEANRDRYVWKDIGASARLCEVRMLAMRRFLHDFP